MSVSKRALSVEGFKSTPRKEPSFEQIKDWMPKNIQSFSLREITLDKRKIKVIYDPGEVTFYFTLTEIDEAAQQSKHILNEVKRLLKVK